jgi:hypothetical protein
MPIDDRRHRKPFSNKQKKDQLQAKRERKRNRSNAKVFHAQIIIAKNK